MLSFITLRSIRKKKATQKQKQTVPVVNSIFQSLGQAALTTPPSASNTFHDIISIGESSSYIHSTVQLPPDAQTVTTTTTALTGASRSNETSPAIQIEFDTEPLLFENFLQRPSTNDLQVQVQAQAKGKGKILSTKSSFPKLLKAETVCVTQFNTISLLAWHYRKLP